MADFVKIRLGDDDEGNERYTMFNLHSIESVNLATRRVYTIGATHPYVIRDDKSWDKILAYVKLHTSERHF